MCGEIAGPTRDVQEEGKRVNQHQLNIILFFLIVYTSVGLSQVINNGKSITLQYTPRPSLTHSLSHLQANLSLYTVTALLILDSDGQRVLAKYYTPPYHQASTQQHAGIAGSSVPEGLGQGLGTVKEQKAFEKSVHEKTRRGGSGESASER